MATINDIAKCLKCAVGDISNVVPLSAGMTNQSFIFTYHNRRYIYRIPGKGAEGLVDRQNEYEAYKAIRWLNISDKVVYYDKASGVKISEYIEHARNANGDNIQESIKCLLFAKHELHDKCKTVNVKIDIIDMINKYEHLMGKSKYDTYFATKSKIITNLRKLRKQPHKYCLCHFDLNPDNFVIVGKDKIKLLDWEYAGMNDPLFDLAGWIVYKKYNESDVYELIKGYLEHVPTQLELSKIYAYIAAMGLLWSNWCEYKRKCGQEFGDYAEQQYEYARKYFNK